MNWPFRTSYQPGSAGPAADGRGHRADGADGGAAGAVGQRRHPHGHALALLGLGRAGGREADADHLVDGGEQAELGEALEVSAEKEETARMWVFVWRETSCRRRLGELSRPHVCSDVFL